MSVTLHFLREGDLFLDVGANVGSYTVLAAGACRAEVWAFEPDPTTAISLRRNVALNGLNDRVEIHEIALGDRDGEVNFTCGLDTRNRVATPDDIKIQRVPIRRFDSLLNSVQPTMLKVDAEGHDESIIQGAQRLLSANSLKLIIIETVANKTEETLDKFGFEQVSYNPFSRELVSPSTRSLGSNRLFVRGRDYVADRLREAPQFQVLGRSI